MTHKQLSWRCSNQALSVLILFLSVSLHAMEQSSSSSSSSSKRNIEEETESSSYNNLTPEDFARLYAQAEARAHGDYRGKDPSPSDLLPYSRPINTPHFDQFDAQARETAKLSMLNELRRTNPRRFIELSLPKHVLEHVTFPDKQKPEEAQMYWDAAPEDLKIIVEDVIQNPDTELFSNSGFPRQMVFWGPPGTGKSETAAAVAWVLGRPYLRIKCSSLGTGTQNSISDNLGSFIEPVLKLLMPFVLIFEEISTATQNIGLEDKQGSKAALTLNGFDDDIKKKRRRDILSIGTTNEPEILPEPTIDRVGECFYQFERQNPEQQIQKFIAFLRSNAEFPLAGDCENFLLSSSHRIAGYSSRRLESLVETIQSFASDRAQIENGAAMPPFVITIADIERAFVRSAIITEKIVRQGQGNRSLTQKLHDESIGFQRAGLEQQQHLHDLSLEQQQRLHNLSQTQQQYLHDQSLEQQRRMQNQSLAQQQRIHDQSHATAEACHTTATAGHALAKANERKDTGGSLGTMLGACAAVTASTACPLLAPILVPAGQAAGRLLADLTNTKT